MKQKKLFPICYRIRIFFKNVSKKGEKSEFLQKNVYMLACIILMIFYHKAHKGFSQSTQNLDFLVSFV